MKTIQDYKIESILNKIVRYEEGTMTRKEWIILQKGKGNFVKEVLEPRVRYNRIKSNRMDYKEQEEYMKKCNEMKTSFRLYVSENSSYDITKSEFDYFNNLPNYSKNTIDHNLQEFSKMIGKKYRGYNNGPIESAEVTEVKYINKNLCVIIDDDEFINVETFCTNFIQLVN